MEDLGVRMVGPVQKHLFSNQAWCTALLMCLPPLHTATFIQSCPRSLTVPQSRPTALATVLMAKHVILQKKKKSSSHPAFLPLDLPCAQTRHFINLYHMQLLVRI